MTLTADLTADHIGQWVECRTPDHGIVAGRLVHIERVDDPTPARSQWAPPIQTNSYGG